MTRTLTWHLTEVQDVLFWQLIRFRGLYQEWQSYIWWVSPYSTFLLDWLYFLQLSIQIISSGILVIYVNCWSYMLQWLSIFVYTFTCNSLSFFLSFECSHTLWPCNELLVCCVATTLLLSVSLECAAAGECYIYIFDTTIRGANCNCLAVTLDWKVFFYFTDFFFCHSWAWLLAEWSLSFRWDLYRNLLISMHFLSWLCLLPFLIEVFQFRFSCFYFLYSFQETLILFVYFVHLI